MKNEEKIKRLITELAACFDVNKTYDKPLTAQEMCEALNDIHDYQVAIQQLHTEISITDLRQATVLMEAQPSESYKVSLCKPTFGGNWEPSHQFFEGLEPLCIDLGIMMYYDDLAIYDDTDWSPYCRVSATIDGVECIQLIDKDKWDAWIQKYGEHALPLASKPINDADEDATDEHEAETTAKE